MLQAFGFRGLAQSLAARKDTCFLLRMQELPTNHEGLRACFARRGERGRSNRVESVPCNSLGIGVKVATRRME
jgi:hypothetical protein